MLWVTGLRLWFWLCGLALAPPHETRLHRWANSLVSLASQCPSVPFCFFLGAIRRLRHAMDTFEPGPPPSI